MYIKALMPDQKVSMEKYGEIYKSEEAARESKKNSRRVAQTYILLACLFILSFGNSLYKSICVGDAGYLDLLVVTILFAILFILVYKKRYGRIERQIKLRKESISEDFPEFIDKLTLLLSAGMITETALERISEDYNKTRGQTGISTLYEGLSDINRRIHETNSSLHRELSVYALKSGVRELLRFSSIIEDNLSKGSDLGEKLESERALLWMERKKRAEEKARLADTKLSLPLLLILLSLILITTAPMLLSI